MSELDVKVNTDDVKSLLDRSYDEMDRIRENIKNVQDAFQHFESSKVLTGKAGNSLKQFISIVGEDVLSPAAEFNDKMFKALKTVSTEFESETYIDLG